ncbi:MAG: hypothetical protein JKY09_09565 [Crocinitomicaceae bacterium]|nr:hypothetical protein [Crocinitomicaceae bacterium]
MSDPVKQGWGELFFMSVVFMFAMPFIGGAIAIVCLAAFLYNKPMAVIRVIYKWLWVTK